MQGPDGHGWDTTVVFIERKGLWWWNAWDPAAEVEHSGWAGSRDEAVTALADVVAPETS